VCVFLNLFNYFFFFLQYVYDRLTPVLGLKKPGALNQAAVFILSGIWHGVYPGYCLTFVAFTAWVSASKVIFRLQQRIAASKEERRRRKKSSHHLVDLAIQMTRAANFLMMRLGMDGFTPPFLLLHLAPSIKAWKHLQWAPHIVVVLAYLTSLLSPARGQKKDNHTKRE